MVEKRLTLSTGYAILQTRTSELKGSERYASEREKVCECVYVRVCACEWVERVREKGENFIER